MWRHRPVVTQIALERTVTVNGGRKLHIRGADPSP
jgi:hypothetical protein